MIIINFIFMKRRRYSTKFEMKEAIATSHYNLSSIKSKHLDGRRLVVLIYENTTEFLSKRNEKVSSRFNVSVDSCLDCVRECTVLNAEGFPWTTCRRRRTRQMELSKQRAHFRKYCAALRNASGMELNGISRRVPSRVLRHRNAHALTKSARDGVK